jgi:hypothetical protein
VKLTVQTPDGTHAINACYVRTAMNSFRPDGARATSTGSVGRCSGTVLSALKLD